MVRAGDAELSSGSVRPLPCRVRSVLGEERLALWPKEAVMKQLVGAVSIAIQRGNAMSFLSGHTRAMMVSGEEDVSEE